MNISAVKGIKCIINFTILALTFTACIPVAFEGLPNPIGSPNPRADLCALLSKVGLGDQISACLTATTITPAQIAALCAASAGLSEADKALLRANISAEDAAQCEISPTPSPSPTTQDSIRPTGEPAPEITSQPPDEPVTNPTATEQPSPSPTASPGTGGGGSNGGLGGNNGGNNGTPEPTPTNVDINVVVTNGPMQPIGIETGGGG